MDTTIQISKELLKKLQSLKIHSKESYEELIWDLIDDRMELSKETKRAIKEYENDIKQGNLNKFTNLEDVKKELKLNA